MLNCENKEFYPTPTSLLEEITAGCKWTEIKTVLEPSAGKGDIVQFLQEKAKKNYMNEYDIDCIENDAELRATLNGKGMRVIHDDFLTYHGYKKYDLIVMNPPFSNGEEHLLKALEVQKNGGYIICILNAETIRNPYSVKRKVLEKKLQELHAEITYRHEAFTDAERKTDVEVAIIKVQIPAEKTDSYYFTELKTAKMIERAKMQNSTELANADYIEAIIMQYEIETEACIALIKEYASMQPYILEDIKQTAYSHPIIELKIGNKCIADNSINDVLKLIRRKYWNALFNDSRFIANMTTKQLEEYRSKINDLENYDFSYYNIKTLQEKITRHLIKSIEDTIIQLFDKFSYEHSWLPEAGKNIHYYDGWATNKAHIINKKVIIPVYGVFSDIWKKFDYTYSIYEKLSDIEKVFNYLAGENNNNELYKILRNAEDCQQSKNIECRYFSVTFYKKGTCHITFKDEELLKKFNIYGSQKKGWLPPCYGKKKYQEMTPDERKVVDSFEGEHSYRKVMENPDNYLIHTSSLIPMLTDMSA